MSPRNYDMSKRAAAAAQTRRRIVDATRELHAEQGIAATSWDDIAARAGVGVGTVYRHFPTLDELVPACGAVTHGARRAPRPAAPPALFDGVASPAERIERLVAGRSRSTSAARRELRVARREPDAHPSVAEARDALEASLRRLVDTALEPLDMPRRSARSPARWSTSDTWEALRTPARRARRDGERAARRAAAPSSLRGEPPIGVRLTEELAPAGQ